MCVILSSRNGVIMVTKKPTVAESVVIAAPEPPAPVKINWALIFSTILSQINWGLVLIAVVTVTPATILAFRASNEAKAGREQSEKNYHQINSRLDEMIVLVKKEATAEGNAQGVKDEKDAELNRKKGTGK